MKLFRGSLFLSVLLSLLLGLLSTGTASAVGGSNEFVQDKERFFAKVNPERIVKRTGTYVAPQFLQQFYTFDESGVVNGALAVPMVCLRGGQYHERREFALLVASGPEENCFGQPCPPATVGIDYLDIGPQRFFLSTRELRCFNITILDDEEIEGLEFFLLVLEDLRWGEIIGITSITIFDDDSPTFATATTTYSEDAGIIPVCVNGGDITMPVILQSINNSNATGGEDFIEVFSEFTLDPGESLCVDVTILDDTLYEGEYEVINLLFMSAEEANGTFSLQRSLLILDNDPTPRFEHSLYTVVESDSEVEVCIQFNAETTTVVESRIATIEGSAKENTDYIGLNETFMIRGGVQVCRTITIITNTAAESLSSFTVALTSSNSAVSEPFTTVVAILDDDVLEFEDDLYIVNEADMYVRICVKVVSGDVNTEVNATLFTLESTAKEGEDFQSLQQMFTLRGGRKCVFAAAFMDGIEESDEQFYVVVLSRNPVDNSIVEKRFTTVIIKDESTQGLNCTVLSPPTNGNISFTNANNIGSIASYECDLGFLLAGLDTNRRTCSLDGTWTGNDPTCEVLQCPILNDPQNGMVTVPDRSANSVATYTCNPGFRLEGNEERVCDARTGDWTGNAPMCILILCPVLTNPNNGDVMVGLRTLNSIATYNCSMGFVLVGDQRRTCLMSGEWSGTEPQCRTLGEPLQIDLVNESPRIDDKMVSVDFQTNGIAENVVCKLDDIVIEEDFQSRSSGSMAFTDVEPGVHNLEITASKTNPEEKVIVKRLFELSDHPDFCGLHLINKGITIDGDSIRVEFAGRPAAKSYRCKLNNDPGFDCNELVEMEGIERGTHRLKIMHNRAECGPRRKLFLHFTI